MVRLIGGECRKQSTFATGNFYAKFEQQKNVTASVLYLGDLFGVESLFDWQRNGRIRNLKEFIHKGMILLFILLFLSGYRDFTNFVQAAQIWILKMLFDSIPYKERYKN